MDSASLQPVGRSTPSRRRERAVRRTLSASGLLVCFAAACSGGGREIYAGVRFYPRGELERPEEPVAYYENVPLLVVQDPDQPNWIHMDRLLEIRDELGVRHRRDDVLSIVYSWTVPHDTLGSLRWDRQGSRWRPSAVQRTVLEAGGHAALLVEEEYHGSQVTITGYVIRCRTLDGRPLCQ